MSYYYLPLTTSEYENTDNNIANCELIILSTTHLIKCEDKCAITCSLYNILFTRMLSVEQEFS